MIIADAAKLEKAARLRPSPDVPDAPMLANSPADSPEQTRGKSEGSATDKPRPLGLPGLTFHRVVYSPWPQNFLYCEYGCTLRVLACPELGLSGKHAHGCARCMNTGGKGTLGASSTRNTYPSRANRSTNG